MSLCDAEDRWALQSSDSLQNMSSVANEEKKSTDK